MLDVEASRTLTDEQKARLRARFGPRVSAVAQEARSQARNRELALERLAERIEGALRRRRPRKASRPTRAARARRLEAKRRRGHIKRTRQRPAPGD